MQVLRFFVRAEEAGQACEWAWSSLSATGTKLAELLASCFSTQRPRLWEVPRCTGAAQEGGSAPSFGQEGGHRLYYCPPGATTTGFMPVGLVLRLQKDTKHTEKTTEYIFFTVYTILKYTQYLYIYIAIYNSSNTHVIFFLNLNMQALK